MKKLLFISAIFIILFTSCNKLKVGNHFGNWYLRQEYVKDNLEIVACQNPMGVWTAKSGTDKTGWILQYDGKSYFAIDLMICFRDLRCDYLTVYFNLNGTQYEYDFDRELDKIGRPIYVCTGDAALNFYQLLASQQGDNMEITILASDDHSATFTTSFDPKGIVEFHDEVNKK